MSKSALGDSLVVAHILFRNTWLNLLLFVQSSAEERMLSVPFSLFLFRRLCVFIEMYYIVHCIQTWYTIGNRNKILKIEGSCRAYDVDFGKYAVTTMGYLDAADTCKFSFL